MAQPECGEDRRGDEAKSGDQDCHRIAMGKGLLSSCPLTRPEGSGHRADSGAGNVAGLPDRCLPDCAREMTDVAPPRRRRGARLDGTEDRKTYRGSHLTGRIESPDAVPDRPGGTSRMATLATPGIHIPVPAPKST